MVAQRDAAPSSTGKGPALLLCPQSTRPPLHGTRSSQIKGRAPAVLLVQGPGTAELRPRRSADGSTRGSCFQGCEDIPRCWQTAWPCSTFLLWPIAHTEGLENIRH